MQMYVQLARFDFARFASEPVLVKCILSGKVNLSINYVRVDDSDRILAQLCSDVKYVFASQCNGRFRLHILYTIYLNGVVNIS